jgi:hypothetical protein
MTRPVIALLTDFGLRDHYVGTMKGVILGICREAAIVDIVHDVPPHDVIAGSWELAASYRYFPAGTIFVVVVDPGVGTGRRAVAAEAGPYTFVAPDNGVLSLVLDELTPSVIVEVNNPRYMRPVVSRTFEGRDRFGPAAAWLATGVELSAFGPAVSSITRLDSPTARVTPGGIEGQVIRVDRFGNLVTNIDLKTLNGLARSGDLSIVIGSFRVSRLVGTYADVAPGELCAVLGSADRLEIAANGASAASMLGVECGVAVRVGAP